MKRSWFTAVALAAGIVFCPVRSRGQELSNPPTNEVIEPEFAGVVFQLDAGKLIPLERQVTNTSRVRVSPFIVATRVTSSWEFPGAKSPVRFAHRHEALEFVVRGIAALDPNVMYHLYQLEGKKKTRELRIASASGSILGATGTSGGGLVVPIEFSRYGASSLKMSVALPPGEYAFQAFPTSMFCFGID